MSYPFLGLLRTQENPKAEHSISERPIRDYYVLPTGGHKSSAESKHIYCEYHLAPAQVDRHTHKKSVEKPIKMICTIE